MPLIIICATVKTYKCNNCFKFSNINNIILSTVGIYNKIHCVVCTHDVQLFYVMDYKEYYSVLNCTK